MKGDIWDPKALVAEAYNIDGITIEECRSIFMDWALSYDGEPRPAIETLLARHGTDQSHPMTITLTEGLGVAAPPKRRGGRASRVQMD